VQIDLAEQQRNEAELAAAAQVRGAAYGVHMRDGVHKKCMRTQAHTHTQTHTRGPCMHAFSTCAPTHTRALRARALTLAHTPCTDAYVHARARTDTYALTQTPRVHHTLCAQAPLPADDDDELLE
jgi:hypothetical protein